MHNTKHIHDFLRPFFPERARLTRIYGLGETKELSRLHLELLRIIARNEHLDLMDAASLMNIGHVSVAEMVDTLMESDLLEKKSGTGLGVKVSSRAKKIRDFEKPGFLSLKEIVDREREASYDYPLYPKHMNPPRYA